MAMKQVLMGRLLVSKAPDVLTSSGIGSCVTVALYDPKGRAGGLSHILRPKYDGRETENKQKFADTAIIEMISQLISRGSKREDISAKVIGGANMFPEIIDDAHDIGRMNSEAVKAILKQESIKVAHFDTGGTVGKSVAFDLSTGLMEVRFQM